MFFRCIRVLNFFTYSLRQDRSSTILCIVTFVLAVLCTIVIFFFRLGTYSPTIVRRILPGNMVLNQPFCILTRLIWKLLAIGIGYPPQIVLMFRFESFSFVVVHQGHHPHYRASSTRSCLYQWTLLYISVLTLCAYFNYFVCMFIGINYLTTIIVVCTPLWKITKSINN